MGNSTSHRKTETETEIETETGAEQTTATASSDEGTSSVSEYQVFLSFRGPDTREGFSDVLFHGLTDAGICVFRDDEKICIGGRIGGSLWRAIDDSKIYIPVFSRTYASSRSCLRELVQIVQNTSKSEGNKEILPIFFDVDPDDVKLKTPLYHNTMLSLKHERNLSSDQVDEWREALMETAVIRGWEVKKYKGHGDLIKLIVKEVVKKLKRKHRLVTEHLVGIDDRVGEVGNLLDVDSVGVQLIKIHGMGGIGKTTLAKVVFNKLSSHFGKSCCFLEDVQTKSSRTGGLLELQKRLISEIGGPDGIESIDEINYGMMRIGEVLSKKKVLVVLDDVGSSEQAEKLIGKYTLCSGSRILITTRNKDVLRNYRPKFPILDYEMKLMSTDYALQLFSKLAFNSDSPPDDYNDLSRKIVIATGRLPLALEVIGSFLYERGQEIWEETFEKLKKAPHEDVFQKLKIRYDALTPEQQQIFLDIACFFIGEDKSNPIYMWKDCKYSASTGVDVLIDMSLIKITKNNRFWMHDQLGELGKEIVCQEHGQNPGKRSRLWIREEILETMTTKKTKNVLALDLDVSKCYPQGVIKSEEIERFKHLRYLKFNGGTFIGDFTNCLTKLTWISWSHPTGASELANMHLENLAVLQFSDNDFIDDSNLQCLIKMARKLKVLSLIRCKSITKTPDFNSCPDLERLILSRCGNLKEIDSSIGKLKSLVELTIHFCDRLRDLPEEIGDLVNLKHFSLTCCKVEFPYSIWKLKSLREVNFVDFFLPSDAANSWELPSSIGMLQNLEVLRVTSHFLKGQLPSDIGNLPHLRILEVSNAHVSEVPETISMLPRLQRLELENCDEIQELPALPTSLTHLKVSSGSLCVVPDLSNLTNLVELELNDERIGGCDQPCTGGLWWIGRLSKLTNLSLRLDNVPAPTELASLRLLNQLDLFGLNLQPFPELPLSLQNLGLGNFRSLVSLSPNMINLSRLELHESSLREIELNESQLPHLRELHVKACFGLKTLKLSSMRKLEIVYVGLCSCLVEIQFSRVSLKDLTIAFCESLRRLVYAEQAGQHNHESVYGMVSGGGRLTLQSRALNKLQKFVLMCCPQILEIQVAGTSESWEQFALFNCNVQSIGGLSNLKNLKSLLLYYNDGLRVVTGIDELEFLANFDISDCRSLEWSIDVSSTKLPNDCRISISGCREDFRGSVQSYKYQHKGESEEKRKGQMPEEAESSDPSASNKSSEEAESSDRSASELFSMLKQIQDTQAVMQENLAAIKDDMKALKSNLESRMLHVNKEGEMNMAVFEDICRQYETLIKLKQNQDTQAARKVDMKSLQSYLESQMPHLKKQGELHRVLSKQYENVIKWDNYYLSGTTGISVESIEMLNGYQQRLLYCEEIPYEEEILAVNANLFYGSWLRAEMNNHSPFWKSFYEAEPEGVSMEEEYVPESTQNLGSHHPKRGEDREGGDKRKMSELEPATSTEEIPLMRDGSTEKSPLLLELPSFQPGCEYLQQSQKKLTLRETKKGRKTLTRVDRKGTLVLLDEENLMETPVTRAEEQSIWALVACQNKPPGDK
ncbi:disease resistance protein L6-like [Rhodamnia argentea]|uniref:Disease resistance protein L6-like n=1 Tax=Rhodamnia argentea TaxID=178133 RepID=A0ABM3HW38_9MYRT|nr:disease resistance protein L6-like [Rhodamnia argentea]